MDRGHYVSRDAADTTTLGEVIDRYIDSVVPKLRGAKEDRIRLTALRRHRLCRLSMTALSPSLLASFRDERLRQVKPATVVRELAYMSAIINHARREWAINCANPVAAIKKPSPPPGRDRLLSADEREKLLSRLTPTGRKSPWMRPLVELALETGMRRGELLAMQWDRVNLPERVVQLDMTKNGDKRTVPLSTAAAALLSSLPRSICGQVFPITEMAVNRAFSRAVIAAGIDGFRFHDLRHTAITAMAEKLPNVIELSAVTGHRSLRMLQRYYHPKATELALKLG